MNGSMVDSLIFDAGTGEVTYYRSLATLEFLVSNCIVGNLSLSLGSPGVIPFMVAKAGGTNLQDVPFTFRLYVPHWFISATNLCRAPACCLWCSLIRRAFGRTGVPGWSGLLLWVSQEGWAEEELTNLIPREILLPRVPWGCGWWFILMTAHHHGSER